MATIIDLFGDPHRKVQKLLPWYATGQLDPADRSAVETHLGDCEICCADLARERDLARAVANLPIDADARWFRLRRKLLADTPARRRKSMRQAWQGKLFWLLAGQASVAVLVVAMLWFGAPVNGTSGPYRTLGSAEERTGGNAIVIFRPDTTEAELRDSLTRANARLVDGPTESGAYVLRIAQEQRDAAIKALRGNRDVVLAQPVEPLPDQGSGR